jgi:16S rRNA (uracil1498-N3)-methyltransferase
MIFYAPDIENDRRLPEEESQHAVKVLRLKEGDKIEIVDGKGCFYHAEITFPHAKHCEVEILSKTENFQPQPVHLHIAIAPTKNMDRLEWFAEKVTEIGVGEITPLLCERSERKVLKHDRLEKILVSAMKQSKKAYLPRLNELKKFSDFATDPLFVLEKNSNRTVTVRIWLEGEDENCTDSIADSALDLLLQFSAKDIKE